MKKILISLLLLSLTSCTGAVIIPGILVFGMQQESNHMEHSVDYRSPPNYANFDNVDYEMRLNQLRAEWDKKFSEIQ